jgi:hypothetical protein
MLIQRATHRATPLHLERCGRFLGALRQDPASKETRMEQGSQELQLVALRERREVGTVAARSRDLPNVDRRA